MSHSVTNPPPHSDVDQLLSADAAYRAILSECRDMRHFTGGTVALDLLHRLLQTAHQAPSVGLMQPWRFIRISDRQLRGQIQQLVEEERIRPR